jgi:hypothetical protein
MGMTPQEAARALPPLTDAQCIKVAALLSLVEVNNDEQQAAS